MGIRRHAVADDGRQLDFLTISAPVRPLANAGMTTGTLARAVTGEISSLTLRGPNPFPPPPASESSGVETPSAPAAPQLTAAALPPVPAGSPPSDYRITDADRLGEGSLAQKTRANLDALALLKRLDAAGRPATAEEQRVMVRYVGWGGLPQVFDPRNIAWARQRAELQGLLTAAEFASARATTLNAHYTPPVVIRAMYALLERLGFPGGRVLEPACGLGHFLGLMPETLRNRSTFTAIEIDAVSARLAQHLYPGADLRHQPFEESRLADDFYDVALSNVPFGDYRPFDPRFAAGNFLIHDYFFAAALTKVRPGGLLLFLTSKGTLDKADATLRAHLDQTADFVGALRLPNTAFKQNANTQVTTDLVVLRKRLPGEARAGHPWRELQPITNSLGERIAVNEWYAAHPTMMLGELRLSGRMYRHAEPTLVATGDLAEQLAEAIRHFPAGVFSPVERPSPPLEVSPVPASAELKPNAFTLLNGELARREGDLVVRLTGLPASTATRLRGLIRLRDAIRHCLQTQWENRPEEEITHARVALNQTYELFVAKFGPVSDRRNTAAFRGDPDLPLLLSVEHYDRESGRATKAALFHERTITQRSATADVTDAKSALLVTLNERGRVDLEFLGQLLRKNPAECLPDLQGLIFLNPQSQTWETDDAYLSGNVKAKLAAAEAAALADPQFTANVAALRTVQPADLTATEIDARLGSSWVPPEDLVRFAAGLLGTDGIRVEHAPVIGTWSVRGRADVRGSVANTAEWGTERRGALDLLEDALNLRTPTIYDYDAPNNRMVLNGPATEAARDKQQKLKDRFQEWVWRDDDRRERLLRIYNDQFNCVRLRTFNGDHLALPGASSAVDLRGHQKAGVWRILQTPNTLLAHVVGAGKTYTMVAAALELRRLGLARKPLFAVPNHMLEQFAAELLTLYPAANILVASKGDFQKQRRQTLMSRIATGNWDAVIVTHSGFEKIPLARATRERFFTEQLEELADAILHQKANDDRGSRIVKELEQAKKRLETKLKELLAEDRKDEGLTFEQLGVDRLFVDEAHCFKNLFYVSKMTRLAGLPQSVTPTQRLSDSAMRA